MASGNIIFIQPYMFEPETYSKEEEEEWIIRSYQMMYQNASAFYVSLSTTPDT